MNEFREMQGKHSSSGARQHEMAQRTRGVYIVWGYVVGREGGDVSGVDRLWIIVRSWAMRAFPLVLLSGPKKLRIEMETVRKYARQSRFQWSRV